ncbi:TIR domain-containing protein [Lentzea sp. NPDC058436]|uniref:TIR domain-containing protein n=1 Tax=Lentzea sp. NPDC058436 TaxID=3346499 RepID=UPI00365E9DBE
MPPADATTLRGALLTLGHEDDDWLTGVDRLLGRALTNTSSPSPAALIGWLDGGEAPELVRARLTHVTERLAFLRGRARLDPVFALHTALIATVFFETVRDVLAAEIRFDVRRWSQEDHSFATYLYSDEMPTFSATSGLGDGLKRWVADRGVRVRLALRRTSAEYRSEALGEQVFVDRVASRFAASFEELVPEVPEFGMWAAEPDDRVWRHLLGSAGQGRIRAALSDSNQALLDEAALGTYVVPNHRLAEAGPSARPADENWWAERPVRQDVHALLGTHFVSPGAFRSPLLVVGAAGTGKSMLTKVLAARLSRSGYTALRVSLRATAPEATVVQQIQQALRRQTRVHGDWTELAAESSLQICVVLLDGLDDMPQVSGGTRNYLMEVVRFQQNESAAGRPVAVVVTCRTSFLTRIVIPDGTPLVQLAEFDDAQIDQWVGAWNRTHAERRPLTPETRLVRNPYLLSLLAVQLTESDSPTARVPFQSAVEVFAALSPDLSVTGVAALGMLNRGWRPISEAELRGDLTALGHLDTANVEPVLRELDQQPSAFAEHGIAAFVLDVLATTASRSQNDEFDDDLLFALLSRAALSFRPFTLEVVTQLSEGMSELRRAHLTEALDVLLGGVHTREHLSKYASYRPSPPQNFTLPAPSTAPSLATYAVNLALLRLFMNPASGSPPLAAGLSAALLDMWASEANPATIRSLQSLLELRVDGISRRSGGDTAGEVQLAPDRTPAGVTFVHRLPSTSRSQVVQITWSPDGDLLTTGHGNGQLTCWRMTAGANPEVVSELIGVSDVAWHPTRPFAAVVQQLTAPFTTRPGFQNVVLTWLGTRQSRELCSVRRGTRISWSPDGESLAAFDADSLWLLDGTTGERRQLAAFTDPGEQTVLHLLTPRWAKDGDEIWTAGGGVVTVSGNGREPVTLARFDLQALATDIGDGRRAVAAFGNGSSILTVPLGRQDITVELEGHTKRVTCGAFSPDGGYFASMAEDDTVRIWRRSDWHCVAVIARDQISGPGGLAFHPTEPLLAMKNGDSVDVVRLDHGLLGSLGAARTSRLYANAKIVLVGDTGVGKSGLGLVLSGRPFAPTDSTHGRNVWTFEKSIGTTPSGDVQTRETLLWDLAGQPGYRMVHQLHLNEVAVALVVFDARSETDPFAGVRYWSRALAQARRLDGAAAVRLRAYLVAARTDRGGTAVSPARIQQAVDLHGFDGFVETSAKEGWGVDDLIRTAREAIDWDAVPVVSSTDLFQSIKDFVVEEKRQGRILSTADDLLHGFRHVRQDESPADELAGGFTACLGRLESVGVVRRMHFGDYVLLRPELLDSYVSSLVQAAKDEPDGLGFVPEKDALEGTFRMPESERLPNGQQERVLLIAVVEELLRREIALKEVTDKEVDLIFPSQFTRERPDAPEVPGQDVVFTFDGALASIYSTLAVRLSHSRFFQKHEMWHNSATFTADAGGTCGIAIREVEEGKGELVLFHDEQVQAIVRRQFEAYVMEHLQSRAGNVVLRRVRRCRPCDHPVDDVVVRKRLGAGFTNVRCQLCDGFVSLLDEEQPDVRPVVAAMNSHANARRDLDVAATTLKGKREAEDYDVFLCHNVRDKSLVMKVVAELEARGILPWLDIHDIPPGSRWQNEMANGIEKSRSAAVLVGPSGFGPWHDAEMQLISDWSVRDARRRVIPVFLEGADQDLKMPGFLRVWSTVDMRTADPDPVEQLVWGVTGEQPHWS